MIVSFWQQYYGYGDDKCVGLLVKKKVLGKTVFQFLGLFIGGCSLIVLCLLSLIQNSNYLLMLYNVAFCFCCAGCPTVTNQEDVTKIT